MSLSSLNYGTLSLSLSLSTNAACCRTEAEVKRKTFHVSHYTLDNPMKLSQHICQHAIAGTLRHSDGCRLRTFAPAQPKHYLACFKCKDNCNPSSGKALQLLIP